jgi:hypothetical protein
MPLIRIENYPKNASGYPNVTGLATALRCACVTAEVPFIKAMEDVTVVAGGMQLIDADKTLVVLVEGLFDRPERTKEVRDRLANCLARHAKMNLPAEWTVEVLVKRFNPEKDSFVELGPDWKEE